MDWLEPWSPVTDPVTCQALEQQLRREIGATHRLAGCSVHLVARRRDTDDALFRLGDGRIAEVHLTWRTDRGADPHSPTTVIYGSLEAWARASMAPLHAEFARGT